MTDVLSCIECGEVVDEGFVSRPAETNREFNFRTESHGQCKASRKARRLRGALEARAKQIALVGAYDRDTTAAHIMLKTLNIPNECASLGVAPTAAAKQAFVRAMEIASCVTSPRSPKASDVTCAGCGHRYLWIDVDTTLLDHPFHDDDFRLFCPSCGHQEVVIGSDRLYDPRRL